MGRIVAGLLLALLLWPGAQPNIGPALPPKPTWDATRTPSAPTMGVGTALPANPPVRVWLPWVGR